MLKISMGRFVLATGAAAVVAATSVQTVSATPRLPFIEKSAHGCSAQHDDKYMTVSLPVHGRTREYLLHFPAHAAGEHLPLVLAFHGRGETPEDIASYSGLSTLHAVVAYPRGVRGRGRKLSWSGTPTAKHGVNDVLFANAIVDQIATSACLDEQQIYATGKSDGAGVAAQLACESADRFAAAILVSGAYYPIAGGCHPARPISIIEVHGTADRVVPIKGSKRRHLPQISEWLSAWAERDGCSKAPTLDEVADGVILQRWSECRDSVIVGSYRIHGGGHTWPGAVDYSGPGKTSKSISARDIISQIIKPDSIDQQLSKMPKPEETTH